jgi:DivIVA domain-containing protein
MTDWQPLHFSTTRLRAGYEISEVNEFVARIEGTLGRSMPPDRPVTAADIEKARFTATRFRVGYDEKEVDAAMRKYLEELDNRRA